MGILRLGDVHSRVHVLVALQVNQSLVQQPEM